MPTGDGSFDSHTPDAIKEEEEEEFEDVEEFEEVEEIEELEEEEEVEEEEEEEVVEEEEEVEEEVVEEEEVEEEEEIEEGGQEGEFDGDGDEDVDAMQVKNGGNASTRSDMLSTILDHTTEKLEGCNNVYSIHEVDEKMLNSDIQTTSLHSELSESLDGKNVGNFAAKDASVLIATSQVYDQGTKSIYSGEKQSESPSLVDKDLHLEELREIPKERGLHVVSEKPTPRRSRSPSADVALEPDSKRSAMLCDFFAKGWCIKGSSCRFLHQKYDVTENARRSTKSELSEKASKVETKDTEGFREETKRKSTLSELRSSQTDKKSSSLSNVLLQRALVRAYGDEKQGDKFPRGNVSDQHRFPSSSDHYHLSDEFSSSKSLMVKYYPVPDHRFSSSSSYIGPGVHDPFYNDKYALDRSLHRQKNQSETPNTLNWTGIHPFDPTLANSFCHESSVAQTYAHQVNSYIHGYGSQSNRLLCKNDALDFGRRHFSNSSSGSYLSPDYPRDTPVSLGDKSQYQNKSAWKPSMRFQSSFFPSAKVSSPGSQYDPLLDSIEPPKSSTESPSRISAAQIFSRESQSPLYNTQKLSETVSDLHGSNYTFGNGMNEDLPVVMEPLIATGVRKNGYLSNEDKNHSSSYVDVSPVMQLDNNLRSQGDGNKQNKESKVLKIFRAALAEFVKDLLKPSWREGHLSKDAHKLIVKKAVEKVIGALQPHQIPINTESTNQYFSNSRPKLLKLVEGYVEKYKSATQ